MAIDDRTREADVLHRLIRMKTDLPFGVFHTTGEGKKLPDGTETSSGFVITAENQVFFFWLDWDQERGEPALVTWDEDELDPDWDDREYQEARRTAGLDAA